MGGASSNTASAHTSALSQAQDCLAALAKPVGSLGELEAWAARLATLQRAEWVPSPKYPLGQPSASVSSPALLIFAADHGSLLAQPELSAFPRSSTQTIFRAIAAGGAASAVLAKANGATLELVDVGIDAVETAVVPAVAHVRVRVAKVARGCADSSKGPAMTHAQYTVALAEGAAAVRRALEGGCNVICVGELGLGNSTAAAAILCALGGGVAGPDEATGSGTGLDETARHVKVKFVRHALDTNRALILAEGPSGALRALGGFELVALAGAIIEAARRRVAVIIDGFIAGAAALAAVRIAPDAASACFISHTSAERGAARLCAQLVALGCSAPALALGLRLGEGTGALAVIGVLRSAAAIFEMITLEEAMQLADHRL
ncbi:nicotinate-nucleotide-dimethylbenzimidazole phosphoribosyltransferase-like protein [Pavlovales sp. CCMP2436]|nr:nicotinate-nucleotide-dimethylbenzimidazole phosphoribosyltransferase-like protein [Pavlovales sp. CCMP2436]|mmetsp:Transcript_28159/g.66090  ORF Transcript_28159/g.66090 Transcript_28159/m.66090 type:complete len:378 (-) Transcript_28159:387-1520(-)